MVKENNNVINNANNNSALMNKLRLKQNRVNLKYRYYEQKFSPNIKSLSRITHLNNLRLVLGWCTKAVDVLANRLIPTTWDNDNFNISNIYNMNNPDTLYRASVQSALISGCSFISITPDIENINENNPTLTVYDGASATGFIDTSTGFLTSGIAILSYDELGSVKTYAEFYPDRTDYYEIGTGKDPISIKNNTGVPLLVPIINQPTARRPFGISRITRACMNLVDGAIRTLLRQELSAEYFSFPQRYLLGADQSLKDFEDKDDLTRFKSSLSTLLTISKGEGDTGNMQIGEFQRPSMSPFNEQVKMLACLFSGETALSLQELGFNDGNPSSADAIENSREPLILQANACIKTFTQGFKNVGILASSVRDNTAYNRSAFTDVNLNWLPVFRPNLSALGDGILKLNQAIDGFINTHNLEILTGIKSDTVNDENNNDDILGVLGVNEQQQDINTALNDNENIEVNNG
jgi:hypothetical protein